MMTDFLFGAELSPLRKRKTGSSCQQVYLERLSAEDVLMKSWNQMIINLFDPILCLLAATVQTACHARQGLGQLLL